MNRKQINEYITKELNGWAKGYSVEARLYQEPDNWDGENITLTQMRKVANSGEIWFLNRWDIAHNYINDMMEIRIPK